MSENINQLDLVLKRHCLSNTYPRQVVFEALQNKEPQTMRELLVACQLKINRASLYRTIGTFEKLGIVQRLQIGWKYKLELSNAYQKHHHHFSCRKCGRMFALPEDNILEKRLLVLADSAKFKVEDHQIEMRGLCQSCKKDPSV